jgi:uncharacterized protein involved in response to NO
MAAQTSTRTSLLPVLAAAFYALLTIAPNSHSLIVSWPWVAVWQLAFVCPVLWLVLQIYQGKRLVQFGAGRDLWLGAAAIATIISMVRSPLGLQSQWQGWIALACLGAVYALSEPMARSREKLLRFQGYLSLGFIALSLFLWVTQTWHPALQNLAQIKQVTGLDLGFNFSDIAQRNWAPLGHQNYVAGYLCLAIPLLVGLGVMPNQPSAAAVAGPLNPPFLNAPSGYMLGDFETDLARKSPSIGGLGGGSAVFLIGAGFGILDLYTTSSRSGWIGLIIGTLAMFYTWVRGQNLSAKWIKLGGIAAGVLLLAGIFSNQRWQKLGAAIATGQMPGDFNYRLITIATGWNMGLQNLFTGTGPGSVPLLYSKYRPLWGGWEAEQAYQLHSLPIQIWAELGLMGVGLMALLLIILFRQLRKTDVSDRLSLSIFVSLIAYGVQSLWDYQLDNPAIAGTLIVLIAALWKADGVRKPLLPVKTTKPLALAIVSILIVGIISVFPIDRAWATAHQGFAALNRALNAEDPKLQQTEFQSFTTALTTAHQLQPQNPYYSQQLAWVLGDRGLKTNNPALIKDSIAWFDRSKKSGLSQEFSATNEGWLLLQSDPVRAAQSFREAATLLPSKRGLFYGLGLSLLYQGKVDLAIESIALECLREPLFIASPLWQNPKQRVLYDQVLNRLNGFYETLLTTSKDAYFTGFLRHEQTSLQWWRGDRTAVEKQLQSGVAFPEIQVLWDLEAGRSPKLDALQDDVARWTVMAWTDPPARMTNLLTAWAVRNQSLPPKALFQQLKTTMDQSKQFESWVRSNPRETARLRSGFNVLSRNMDGIPPRDFTPVAENIVLTDLYRNLLRSDGYFPPLDQALQPLKQDFLKRSTP